MKAQRLAAQPAFADFMVSGVGVAYDYRQATFSGGKSLNELSLSATYRVTNTTRLRGYVFKGVTDGGPDWSLGASA